MGRCFSDSQRQGTHPPTVRGLCFIGGPSKPRNLGALVPSTLKALSKTVRYCKTNTVSKVTVYGVDRGGVLLLKAPKIERHRRVSTAKASSHHPAAGLIPEGPRLLCRSRTSFDCFNTKSVYTRTFSVTSSGLVSDLFKACL